MSLQALAHLPELAGPITPPEASGLRLTDVVRAVRDAQARDQGLPHHWRLPDEEVERSRQPARRPPHGAGRWRSKRCSVTRVPQREPAASCTSRKPHDSYKCRAACRPAKVHRYTWR